jgi:hypothetical protein
MMDSLNSDQLLHLACAGDPVLLAQQAGINPDPWQEAVLQSGADRMLVVASRQIGKTTSAALLALHQCLYIPGSLVLLVSPSQRQSAELFRSHCMAYYHSLTDVVPLVSQTQLSCEFANGSRIVALPADETTVRGFSRVALLIVDEASRTPDSLFKSVTPMLAVSKGRIIAITTPFIKRGWFYEALQSEDQGWEKHIATVDCCPRISKEFLDNERKSLGDVFFAQEYLCSWTDSVNSVFPYDVLQRALKDDLEPLFA